MKISRKRLLLIGGGHAHLFVLEALRRQSDTLRAQFDITLLSSELETPYSGMLPGLVAGHYRTKECHIDLRPLAAAAGVRLLQATVDRIDLTRNRAYSGASWWPFQVVSIDIGSTPPLHGIPGAAQIGIPVKPIERFLQQWRTFEAQVVQLARPVHIVMVGGGAGGIELLLAMAHRLQAHSALVKWSLVSRGALLPGYPRRAAQLVAARLANAGIAVRSHCAIACVEPDRLLFDDGSTAAFDQLLWATGSAPQAWPAAAGLACTEQGFVSVNQHLQSVSHAQVFAAGDIASDALQARPKAGVFAVRQGPVLADNLLRALSGETLRSYTAQRDYLSLLATGGRHAIASWHGLVWQGGWVWRWKNRIDRSFMQRFAGPFQASHKASAPNE